MLACARIGAIHSVVFGGFAAKELATRIDDAEPKVILSASCGIEPNRVVKYKPLLDEAIDARRRQAGKGPDPAAPAGRGDDDRRAAISTGPTWSSRRWLSAARCEPEEMAATDPLYILYTSGTTGMPKGVVRDNGGHAVALNWTMKNLYDIEPGEVFWAASDVGWVVGHSYIVYAPLLHGAHHRGL